MEKKLRGLSLATTVIFTLLSALYLFGVIASAGLFFTFDELTDDIQNTEVKSELEEVFNVTGFFGGLVMTILFAVIAVICLAVFAVHLVPTICGFVFLKRSDGNYKLLKADSIIKICVSSLFFLLYLRSGVSAFSEKGTVIYLLPTIPYLLTDIISIVCLREYGKVCWYDG